MASGPRAKRLGETDRAVVHLQVDGVTIEALQGDTALTAILLSTGQTGTDAFNKTSQSGFCLMGACQSCWVWTEAEQRLRACDIEVRQGLRLFTTRDGLGS